MNEVHIIYCIALHACMAIDPMRTQTVNRFSACGLVLCCHYLARLFAVAAGAVLPCFWPLVATQAVCCQCCKKGVTLPLSGSVIP